MGGQGKKSVRNRAGAIWRAPQSNKKAHCSCFGESGWRVEAVFLPVKSPGAWG